MKRNNFTKLTAAILAMCLTLSLTACGTQSKESSSSQTADSQSTVESKAEEPKAEESKEEAPAEEVTLTWFGPIPGSNITKGIPDQPALQKIMKDTGIKLDFSAAANVSDMHEKAAMMLAAGDLTDIMSIDFGMNGSKVLNAKAAIPLDELVKSNGQNLQKYCSFALNVSKLQKSDKTQALYFIPNNIGGMDFKPSSSSYTFNIRWDLYKQLGCPALNSYDDLYDVLEKMVALEPTNAEGSKNYATGLWLPEAAFCHQFIDKSFANMAGKTVGGEYLIQLNMDTDTIEPRLTDPDSTYYEGAKFYNKLYRNGLLDPDSATQKWDSASAKATACRYLSSGCDWTLGKSNKTFIEKGMPEKGSVSVLIGNNKNNVYGAAGYAAGATMNHFITTACKQPEKAMDVLNYLASPEGAMTIEYGVKDEQWVVKDGKAELTPAAYQAQLEDKDYSKKLGTRTGFANFLTVLSTDTLIDKEANIDYSTIRFQNVEDQLTPAEKDFCAYYKYAYPTEPIAKIPNHVASNFSIVNAMAAPQGTPEQEKENQIKAYIEANYAKMILQKTEEDYEKEKAAFIKDLVDMGAEDLVQYFAAQYDDLKTQIAAMQ